MDYRGKQPEPGTMEREFGRLQGERSDAFRRATQRRGMPMIYGTGDPAKSGLKRAVQK